jgi:1,4-dihydroxy-2-naphthoate octaprenyltransferase
MVDVAMWGRALRVMPRLDREQWGRLDVVSRWLVATRSAVLVMTFTSAAFAGLLAAKAGKFHLGLWLLVTLGLLLAHATNNLVNDLTDSWKGVDKDNYFRTQYGPQPLESGLMSVRELLVYVAVTGLAALAIGLALVALRGVGVAWLLAAGAAFVLFYTFPLKYIGLGEPTVLLVWGPLMVGGGYYAVTGEWSTPVAVASLAYALGPTAVLFGKHIDKLAEDRAKKIYTLPVILGEAAARWTVLGMLGVQLALVVGLVASGYFTPVMLLALGAAPALRGVYTVLSRPRPSAPPPGLPAGVWPLYCVAAAFAYNRKFGMWFLLALVLDVALSRALAS